MVTLCCRKSADIPARDAGGGDTEPKHQTQAVQTPTFQQIVAMLHRLCSDTFTRSILTIYIHHTSPTQIHLSHNHLPPLPLTHQTHTLWQTYWKRYCNVARGLHSIPTLYPSAAHPPPDRLGSQMPVYFMILLLADVCGQGKVCGSVPETAWKKDSSTDWWTGQCECLLKEQNQLSGHDRLFERLVVFFSLSLFFSFFPSSSSLLNYVKSSDSTACLIICLVSFW